LRKKCSILYSITSHPTSTLKKPKNSYTQHARLKERKEERKKEREKEKMKRKSKAQGNSKYA
jgi:hypothetical protein